MLDNDGQKKSPDMATDPSETSPRVEQRRQRRRELDARRSKCRVRLGSSQQSWGQLKNSLGFSLHSELARHLLDRFDLKRYSLAAKLNTVYGKLATHSCVFFSLFSAIFPTCAPDAQVMD